ncbi:protein Tob1-like [Argopecten irradians]|uniref:protein Tob1-like n=1 Tax=Argopecten irradians TaxID=31199 RepID=UPI00371C23BF
MHVEISVALNFVISYLYSKLPRRRVDLLAEELEKGLKGKFEGHWYPDKPIKGTGYRCVRVNGEKVDPVIIKAIYECGLDLTEVQSYLPAELILWIDPCEVSYKIGEKGPVKILYSERRDEESTEKADREVQAAAGRSFNPDAQCFKPIDNLSSSFGSMNLSPGGLSPSSPTSSNGWPNSASTSPSCALFNSTSSMGGGVCVGNGSTVPSAPASTSTKSPLPAYVPKQDRVPTQFTASTFAQTKFGSTKLKTQAKRPTRLSPTEFGNYFRQRSAAALQTANYNSPQRPRSLSPRDPRVEFYIDQQQRVFMTQQQQQQHQQQIQQLHQQQQQQQQQQLQQQQQHTALRSPQHHAVPATGDLYHNSSPVTHHVPSFGGLGELLPGPLPSPVGSTAVSPENQKSFIEGLNLSTVPYSSQYPHMLLAN